MYEILLHGMKFEGTIEAVTVRVKKPEVQLGGPLDCAALEVRRRREV